MSARKVATVLLGAALFAPSAGANDQIPAPVEKGAVAITGGTVHTVSDGDIIGGTVLFDEGKIVAVGTRVALPDDCRVIDASDKHVYPGIIALNTALGLTEIGAVRATNDINETGEINPNVRVEVAWNPDSELIPVARSNGILTALSAPGGGLVSGRAALMRLDGWTWEEMLLKSGAALVVNWPRRRSGSNRIPIAKEKERSEKRRKRLDELDRLFDDAAAYAHAEEAAKRGEAKPPRYDARLASLRDVIDAATPVLIGAQEAEDIRDAVAWSAARGLRPIIVGGARADKVASLLAERHIPVILTDVNSLSWSIPYGRHSGYDDPFTLPARLHEAGVLFAIAGGGGSWGSAIARNIPYAAAKAAAYGLDREEALRAITLYPAEIFGVADRIGSLRPGLRATLFISDGDILEITSRVESAFIDGREIDLDDHQKELYRKYRTKYRQLGLIE